MKKISQKISYWAGVIVIGIVFGFTLQFVRAWTAPATSAPNGNVGAPLNTSSTSQAKYGQISFIENPLSPGDHFSSMDTSKNGYGIQAKGTFAAGFFSGGSLVGPGVDTHLSYGVYSVYGTGYVRGSKLCIGIDCISSWRDIKKGKEYVGATGASYKGDVYYDDGDEIYEHGYTAADYFCEDKYGAGARVCVAPDFANKRPTASGWYNSFTYDYIYAHSAADPQVRDCSGRTSSSSMERGNYWDNSTKLPAYKECDQAAKFLCCK